MMIWKGDMLVNTPILEAYVAFPSIIIYSIRGYVCLITDSIVSSIVLTALKFTVIIVIFSFIIYCIELLYVIIRC